MKALYWSKIWFCLNWICKIWDLLHFNYRYRNSDFCLVLSARCVPIGLYIMLEGHESCRMLFLKLYSLENFGHTANATMRLVFSHSKRCLLRIEAFSNLALCEQSQEAMGARRHTGMRPCIAKFFGRSAELSVCRPYQDTEAPVFWPLRICHPSQHESLQNKSKYKCRSSRTWNTRYFIYPHNISIGLISQWNFG